MKKDKQGLYYLGELVAENYADAVRVLYDLETADNFTIYHFDAKGYSIVDGRGVQHIYELDEVAFFDELSELRHYEYKD